MSEIDDLIINDVSKISDNIKYNCDSKAGYFYRKFTPINTLSSIPLHKYWVLIDKCKIIDKSSVNLNISVSSANKCISIIKSLEKNTLNKIAKDNDIHIQNDSDSDDDAIPSYSLAIDNKTIFFDQYEKIISCDSVNIGNDASIIAEFNSVICASNKLTPSWRIVQLKVIQIYNIQQPLFDKIIPNKYQYVPQMQQPVTSMTFSLQQPNQQLSSIPQPPPIMYQQKPKEDFSSSSEKKSGSFVPSVADISFALNKLKKTADKKETAKNESNIPKTDLQSIPELKHVETKESISMVEILRQEHKEHLEQQDKEIKEDVQNQIRQKEIGELLQKYKIINDHIKNLKNIKF